MAEEAAIGVEAVTGEVAEVIGVAATGAEAGIGMAADTGAEVGGTLASVAAITTTAAIPITHIMTTIITTITTIPIIPTAITAAGIARGSVRIIDPTYQVI